ncbi:hypothetical protein K5C75_27080, partial [Klebsiella pneumoniae]|nr:hypothetical protein [Klebsiella pneumoniae]
LVTEKCELSDKRARQDEGAGRLSEVARLRLFRMASPSLHYPQTDRESPMKSALISPLLAGLLLLTGC